IIRKRHAAGVDLHDLDPVEFARDADLDLPVEPAGPPQGSVDGIDAVGCADNNYLTAFLEAVHHGQELGNDPAFDLPGHLLAPGRDRIELVDEDDRRSVLACLLEDLPEPLLTLAVIFRDDFGAGDRYEVRPALACDCLCDQGLAGTGRSVE